MYEISVDVGGTFTDFVAWDGCGHKISTKISSNPQEPLKPIFQGLTEIAEVYGLSVEELLTRTKKFTHGTTIGINALLQGKGAKTALLTTFGFRDALELRRSRLANQWDFHAALPPVLVPRYLRLGIKERMDHQGLPLIPLDTSQLDEIADFLNKEKVEAVAVCLLFACQNPSHEQKIKEVIQPLLPQVFITLSSEVSPQLGEYERTVTTVLNARISPLVNRYLDELQTSLAKKGLTVPVLVSQNNGGLTDRLRAGREAVSTLFSGPAGGVKGGLAIARQSGIENLVIADMGGTSLDISVIHKGSMETTQQAEIAGYPVQIPMLDIHTLGAGGGSIAWLDGANMLQVGPRSAGADPGPVCYGKGGQEPTITDATLLLGLLDEEDFLDGRIRLKKEEARRVVKEKLADPLKLSVEETAYAIYRVALSRMVDAIYLMTVKKGYDPRRFALVAVGGALPLFATALARGMGMSQIIMPDSAPVFCADGLSHASLQVELMRSIHEAMNQSTIETAEQIFISLQAEADAELTRLGVDPLRREYHFSADLKYADQHHTINVLCQKNEGFSWSGIMEAFHMKHRQLYGYSQPENSLDLVNLHLLAQETALEPILGGDAAPCDDQESLLGPIGYRSVYLNGQNSADFPVYDWSQLSGGKVIEGPAIIRNPLTTLYLDRESRGALDRNGYFLISTGKEGIVK